MLSASSGANAGAMAQRQKAQITPFDPNIDRDELKESFQVVEEEPYESPLPSSREVRYFFKDVTEVEQLDATARLILYVELKSKSLNELYEKYPGIPKKKLKELKEKRP